MTGMPRAQRVGVVLATPLVQAATAVVLALVLGRLGRDDSSGWGDVIGVIVGVVFGAGIGLALVMAWVSTRLRRPWARRGLVMLLSVPSALVASVVAGVSQVDFWLAYAGYLVCCMGVVWWYTGRVLTPAADD